MNTALLSIAIFYDLIREHERFPGLEYSGILR